MMGKDSVAEAEMRAWSRKENVLVSYHGPWNQMLSLSWAPVNDESPLVSLKTIFLF